MQQQQQQHGSGQELTRAQVATWSAGWDAVQERSGPRCARSEQRQRVRRSVDGLLSPGERKKGGQLAEQAGGRGTPLRPAALAGRSEVGGGGGACGPARLGRGAAGRPAGRPGQRRDGHS